jgi:hypothetical protein
MWNAIEIYVPYERLLYFTDWETPFHERVEWEWSLKVARCETRRMSVEDIRSKWFNLEMKVTELTTVVQSLQVSNFYEPSKRKRRPESAVELADTGMEISTDVIDLLSVHESVREDDRDRFLRYLRLLNDYESPSVPDKAQWFDMKKGYAMLKPDPNSKEWKDYGKNWCNICQRRVDMYDSKFAHHAETCHPMLYNIIQVTKGNTGGKYRLVKDPPDGDTYNHVFFNVPCNCSKCI